AYSGEIRFPLAIEENDEVLVLKLLAESGISINDQKLAAIVIGAKRVQNRWPLNYFKEVVQFLVNSSFKVILIGGKDDYSN
ncbi:glycosyltransferase family 9 protein, partial [Acinetobacter baumannii]